MAADGPPSRSQVSKANSKLGVLSRQPSKSRHFRGLGEGVHGLLVGTVTGVPQGGPRSRGSRRQGSGSGRDRHSGPARWKVGFQSPDLGPRAEGRGEIRGEDQGNAILQRRRDAGERPQLDAVAQSPRGSAYTIDVNPHRTDARDRLHVSACGLHVGRDASLESAVRGSVAGRSGEDATYLRSPLRPRT